MKTVVIENSGNKSFIPEVLSKHNIVTPENIFFFKNFSEVENFAVKHLGHDKKHVDLIITADKIPGNEFGTHLIDWLRNIDLNYSNKNFKLNSLPVILYDKEVRSSDYVHRRFDAVAEKSANDNHNEIINTIKSVVKSARLKVFDDLDLLGIDVEALQNSHWGGPDIHYNSRAKNDPKDWASKTKVLSEDYITRPRKLLYAWMFDEREQMELDIDQYQKILTDLKKYNKVDSERNVLHSLYNKALWILQLDLYNKPIYEPLLRKNKNRFEKPDYVLPSSFPHYIPTNVTEVKPHLLRMIERRKRKPNFLKPFSDALIQLCDYNRFLTKKVGRKQLDAILDYKSLLKIDYTLLASNDDEKYKNL